MALTPYKQKRNFKSTKEPKDRKKPEAKNLIFVVQKHSASHLHYDFRLELNGVLKSWAIPKGPSLNPADKRLAMMVEDHPNDYKDFEGIISEGNYGAGEVIVWDNGVYMPIDGTPDKKENEKKLSAAFNKGDIKIVMLGKKLKGEFALVKMKSKADNSWLLIKKKDEYATSKDITSQNKSVLSEKTIEDLKKKPNP
jgi:bifunctional non-homologous end joining protein LigD